MEKKKIVFLYSELAGYFIACINELLKTPHIEIHIIHWEVNKEAPFNISFLPSVNLYPRKLIYKDLNVEEVKPKQ